MSTEPIREDFLDYPTAWRIAKEGVEHTSDQCSQVQTAGALLCDCGAVRVEWERRVTVQRTDGTYFAGAAYCSHSRGGPASSPSSTSRNGE